MTTCPSAPLTTNTHGTSAPMSSTSRSLAGLACTASTVPRAVPVAVDDLRRR